MARTGKVILAKNINVDKNYKNVLAYTESEMYALVYANKTSELTNCSFIREDNSMEVGLSYAVCSMANYLAFQNTSFSNKWFFAFIDKLEYVSNGVTRIYYTIDIWSTWYDYWTKKPCYIIRQHSNTDVAGDNLVPEGLEHGEYIENSFYESTQFDDFWYVVVSNISINNPTMTNPITNFGSAIIMGAVYVCPYREDIQDLITTLNSTTTPEQGVVLEAYVVPKKLISVNDPTQITELTGGNAAWVYTENTLTKPTSLNNYFPVHKKLLTYPYCYILASNCVGNTATWRYEDFTNNTISVKYWGVPTVGASIVAIPQNTLYSGMIEALVGAKYPTLGIREDSYTNWLTQNAVNNQAKTISNAGSMIIGTALIGAGIFTGGTTALVGAGLLASGTMGAIESGAEYYQHQIEPDSIKGLISSGDILMALQNLTFQYHGMSIKAEYARKLDRFFNKYGYRQNDIQTPLFGSDSYRKYWNYIQIASDEVAAIPKYNNTTGVIINASDLQMINNIFRAGVTIWKLNSNIGDNDLWNTIVTTSNS